MLRIFAVSCIVAALAQALAVGAAPIAVIGASGGVYGLLGAAVPFLFSGDVASGRRNALTFVGVVMGLNLLIGLAGMDILGRSDERRGGTECVSPCRIRWSQEH